MEDYKSKFTGEQIDRILNIFNIKEGYKSPIVFIPLPNHGDEEDITDILKPYLSFNYNYNKWIDKIFGYISVRNPLFYFYNSIGDCYTMNLNLIYNLNEEVEVDNNYIFTFNENEQIGFTLKVIIENFEIKSVLIQYFALA